MKRHAKSYALFFRKPNHFDGKGQAPAAKIFDQSDSEHDPQDAVERARAGNRVEMRADEQPRRGRPSRRSTRP